jgi:hypothetical protein
MIKSINCMQVVLPKKIIKLKKVHDECMNRLDDNLDIVNIIEMAERAKDIKKEEYRNDPHTDSD